MFCEQCQQRQPTVFLTQIINGEVIKRSLCEQCASPILNQLPSVDKLAPDVQASFESMPSISPDPNRPSSVTIPDPVSVRVLASELHLKSFEVIQGLMCLNMFATPQTEIDFLTASALCSRYGVAAHKTA